MPKSQEGRRRFYQHGVVAVLKGSARRSGEGGKTRRAHCLGVLILTLRRAHVGITAVVISICGYDLVRHFIERLVGNNRGPDVFVERVPAEDAPVLENACGGVILQQVAHPHGPAIGEFGRIEQFVNQGVPLFGTRVREKRANFVWRGNAAGEIEMDAPEKFFIGSQPRGGNFQTGKLSEDFVVNEVPFRNGNGGLILRECGRYIPGGERSSGQAIEAVGPLKNVLTDSALAGKKLRRIGLKAAVSARSGSIIGSVDL